MDTAPPPNVRIDSAPVYESRPNSAKNPLNKGFDVYEKTLAQPLRLKGVGLHTGRLVTLNLMPAEAGHGIQFFRSDLHNGARLIKLSADSITQTQLCTRLSNEQGGEVKTIEHLMAALHAFGISNLRIELNGPEVPILDGSSAPFIEAIEGAGLHQQDRPQTYLRVKQAVEVCVGQKSAWIGPCTDQDMGGLRVDLAIDFTADCIGRQNLTFDLSRQYFCNHLSSARTFGFMEQLESLRSQGLARGGNMGNAILIEKGQVKNPEGLRFADEFVRHKALDVVGDLFVEGLPLIGHYRGVYAGHEITNMAMRKLMADPANSERVTFAQ